MSRPTATSCGNLDPHESHEFVTAEHGRIWCVGGTRQRMSVSAPETTMRQDWLGVKRRHFSVAYTGHRMTYRCGCCGEGWPCEDAKAAHRGLRNLDTAEIVHRGALVADTCRLVPDPEVSA